MISTDTISTEDSIGNLISEFDNYIGKEEYCEYYFEMAKELVDDLEDELEDVDEDDERERSDLEAKLEEAINARDFIAIFGDCNSKGACRKGFIQMVSRFGCEMRQIGNFLSCASIYEIEKGKFISWIYIIEDKETIKVKYHYKTSRTEGNATMGSQAVPVHTIHNNFETGVNSIEIKSLKCIGSDLFIGKSDCWNN